MYELSSLLQPFAAFCLVAFLVMISRFLVSRFTFRNGRLIGRRVFVAPRIDPHSGKPGWERPSTPMSPACHWPRLTRVLVSMNVVAGFWFMSWRWPAVNWEHWWIAVPLVLAETHLFIEILFVATTLWNLQAPTEPPPPMPDATVDVYVCTYNEPVDLVRGTVRASKEITFPNTRTYVLDDGNRPEMRRMAEDEGVGYITRTAEWQGKPRHAKAGNIANAMLQTTGEFILLQDADQIPYPEIVDRMLGYFSDSRMAMVQSPQWFYNCPPSDPLGSQQPIFYGPILQGKNRFNSSFFCGSNGMLRREALMQAGVLQYVEAMEERVRKAVDAAEPLLEKALWENRRSDNPSGRLEQALVLLFEEVQRVREGLRQRLPLQDLTWGFQQRAHRIARDLVAADLAELQRRMDEDSLPKDVARPALYDLEDPDLADRLARAGLSPLQAFDVARRLVDMIDLHRGEEAIPVQGFTTFSVTEDMATAYFLHQHGWKTHYHHEILARGMAPEDLPSCLSQRLRWSEGAFQIALRRNPITAPGFTLSQRLFYIHSFLYYFTGVSTVMVLLGPIMYLLVGWPAIRADSSSGMLTHFLPFLLTSQVTFLFWSWKLDAWRSIQYGIAFFPVFIKAIDNAVRDALGLRQSRFVVTPKEALEGVHLGSARWQVMFLVVLTFSAFVGLWRVAAGWDPHPLATLVNVLWAVVDVILLSVVIDAATYRPVISEAELRERERESCRVGTLVTAE